MANLWLGHRLQVGCYKLVTRGSRLGLFSLFVPFCSLDLYLMSSHKLVDRFPINFGNISALPQLMNTRGTRYWRWIA